MMTALAGYGIHTMTAPALWFLGERVVILASSEQTGGRFSMIEDLVAPGGEPPPHSHANEDEAFYLLEGALTVSCGEQTFPATAGSCVFLPRGIMHSWRVTSAEPARFLAFYTPGGFEGFFREGGEPALAATPPPLDTPPDLPKILALAAKYGLLVPPPPGGAQ